MVESQTDITSGVSDLDWIVDNRYKNHKSSLSIYNLINQHKSLFTGNKGYRSTANILLGIAFSLWRSVFLVNIKQTRGSLLNDTEKFLEELIESNIITYAIDRNRRDWSYRYYMSNALYRLGTLSDKFQTQGYPFDVPGSSKGKTPQQQWIDAQVSLEHIPSGRNLRPIPFGSRLRFKFAAGLEAASDGVTPVHGPSQAIG